MNSNAFDRIRISDDNQTLCLRFAAMCDELKVRISEVKDEWCGSEYGDASEDQTQFISGQVERIGADGTFGFTLGDLYDAWGDHLAMIRTGCRWNGKPELGVRCFDPKYEASFYVCSTDEPCMHRLYELGSVLSIVPMEHKDDGTLWIDRYPVKCYEPAADEDEEGSNVVG